MKRAKATGPRDYAMPDYFLADQLYRMGLNDEALAYADSALVIDSMAITAWQVRAGIHQEQRDSLGMAVDLDYLRRLAPQILKPGSR
jgi:hypothetical protein